MDKIIEGHLPQFTMMTLSFFKFSVERAYPYVSVCMVPNKNYENANSTTVIPPKDIPAVNLLLIYRLLIATLQRTTTTLGLGRQQRT